MSLRILQVCPKTPFPPVDGGCIAANNITEGLLKLGHSVKVMSLSTAKHPAEIALNDAEYVSRTGFETCFVDTSIKLIPALRSLVSNRSYNVERFHSVDFERMLVSTLRSTKFDIVHLESAYTAPYLPAIRSACGVPVVCRSHNMEFEIWQGTASLEKNPLKKLYLGHLAARLESFETRICNDFDGIATITEADKVTLRNLGCTVPIETIPFGVDLSAITSSRQPTGSSVFHLGSMDWLPNQDGVRWLLDDVWPKVLTKFPDVRLYLAGRSMPQWMIDLKRPNVEVVGEVDSAFDFIASNSIMVVPLHSGGGMRIKIVEGLALRKAIVSTTLGAAGIDYSDGDNILIADSAEKFADCLIQLLSNSDLRERVADSAQRLARESYDNDVVIPRLVDFYTSLLSR